MPNGKGPKRTSIGGVRKKKRSGERGYNPPGGAKKKSPSTRTKSTRVSKESLANIKKKKKAGTKTINYAFPFENSIGYHKPFSRTVKKK